MQFCCLVTLRGSLYVCTHVHLTGRIPYRSSPDNTSSRGLEVCYVSTDLLYYLTRHCTPWSSAAFFMEFHTVCCSSTSFTLKSRSAVLLVFFKFLHALVHLLAMHVNRSSGIHLARAPHFQASNARRACRACRDSALFLLFRM